MAITFNTATSASTFADLFTDSETDNTWYRLWTGDETGTDGSFVDTSALMDNVADGWITSDLLSSLLADYAQYDDTTLWVQTWNPTDGFSSWESGDITFTDISTVSVTSTVSGDTTLDQMFTDSNTDYAEGTELWYQFWVGDETGTQGTFLSTTQGKGWVLSDNLASETFTAAADGESTELWVRTWVTGEGYGQWEHWTVTTDAGPSLSIGNATVFEGDSGTTTMTFTVTLDEAPGTGESVTVDYATADFPNANLSATADEDYTSASGTLTFAAGVTTQTITVNVAGDTDVETDELFLVQLSNASGAAIGTDSAVGTITTDDVDTPTFSISDATVTEGDTGTATATFTVTLSEAPGTGETVTVDYATADGTATAGTDYTAATGTLSFAAGVTTQTITVNVTADTDIEEDETFTVSLSNSTGTISGDAVTVVNDGTGTITNDDVEATGFSVADVTVTEGDSGTVTATFTVTLNAAPGTGETVTVDYATADGTAVAGTDYTAATGTLSFAAGITTATVTVDITPDTLAEDDETFTLGLSNVTGTISGDTPTVPDTDATATITDDDLSASSYTLTESVNIVTEGETVTYTVTAVDDNGDAAAVTADTSFTYTVIGSDLGGAVSSGSATDVTPASGTVTIAAGSSTATFSITAVDDGTSEGLEGIQVSILDDDFTTVDSETTAIEDSADVSYTLTTDVDDLTGGTGNDTFTGTAPYANGLTTSATFDSGDVVDGGAGTDEFVLTISGSDLDGGADDNETLTPTLSNVETVSIKNYETDAASDVVIDLSLAGTAVSTIGVTASSNTAADTIFQNVGTSADFVHTGAGDMTVTYDGSTMTGSTDSANVDFMDSGSSTTVAIFDITGIETLNVTSSTATNYVQLADQDLETVNVDGDQDIEIEVADADITVFDASTATGTVEADLSAATLANFTTLAGGTATDDVLTLGEDVTVTTASNDLEDVTGFETLALDTGNDISLSSDDGGITDFDLSDANTQSLDLNTGYTSDTTVAIGSADTVDNDANVTLTITADGDDFDNTVTIDGGTATDTIELTAADGTAELDGVEGVETITILAGTTGNETVTMDVGGLDTVVASGETLVIDASDLTDSDATLVFDGSGETNGAFSVTAGAGADTITGGGGDDIIDGGAGNDSLLGGSGDDSISGGSGVDTITAGSGDDTLSGGAGNDTFELAGNLTSADVIDGGDGTDTLKVSAFDADALTNVVNVENLALSGGASVELTSDLDFTSIDLDTSTSSETLTLGSGYTNATTVSVEDGDSVVNTTADVDLTVEADSDDLEAADNTILTGSDASGVTNTLEVTNTGGTIDMQTDITDFDVLNINDHSTVTGTDIGVDVTGYGDAGDSLTIDASELDSGEVLTMTGAATADLTVTGGADGDTLVLGTGDDSISGGAGNDTLTAGTNITYEDTIDGGDGTDTMTVTALTDIDLQNVTNVELLTVTTSANLGAYASDAGITQVTTVANASIDATALTTDLTVNLATGTTTDDVTLGQGDDTIIFDATINMADGDTFDGTSGTDTIRIDNNTGTDTAGDTFTGSLDDITNIDAITINDLATDNTDGDVTLTILDTDYDQSSLTVDASALDAGEVFTFTANTNETDEDFTVTGGAGDDALTTGAGQDSVSGGAGNDTITGGDNGDTLTGGSGADTFTYDVSGTPLGGGTETASESNTGDGSTDTITDFTAGTDNIQLTVDLAGTQTVDFTFQAAASNFSTGQASMSSTIGEMIFATSTNQLAIDLDGNGLIQSTDLVITMTDETTFDDADLNVIIDAAGNGNNSITLGDGDNSVTAGTGNDTIVVGEGDNTIDLSDAGNNSVTAGDGDNSITAGTGNDTITVGDGDNTIDLVDGSNSLTAGDGDNSITGGSSSDTITTGSGDDTIDLSDGGSNTVDAGNGDNTITGGDTTDAITTGSGDDSINAGQGTDTITTGTGTDIVYDDEFDAADTLVDFASGTDGLVLDINGGGSTLAADTDFVWTTGLSGTSLGTIVAASATAAKAMTDGTLSAKQLWTAASLTALQGDIADALISNYVNVATDTDTDATQTYNFGTDFNITVTNGDDAGDMQTIQVFNSAASNVFFGFTTGSSKLYAIKIGSWAAATTTGASSTTKISASLSTVTIATLGTGASSLAAGDIFLV